MWVDDGDSLFLDVLCASRRIAFNHVDSFLDWVSRESKRSKPLMKVHSVLSIRGLREGRDARMTTWRGNGNTSLIREYEALMYSYIG
jgi:hypothetical protein